MPRPWTEKRFQHEWRRLLESRDSRHRRVREYFIRVYADQAPARFAEAVQIAESAKDVDGDRALAIEMVVTRTILKLNSVSPELIERLKPVLPAPAGRILGFDRPMAWLLDRIRHSGNHLAVIGLPGGGKSELARATIHHPVVQRTFGEKRIWIECDGAHSNQLLRNSVLRSMRAPGLEGTDLTSFLDDGVANGGLFVFDGIDSPWVRDPKGTDEVLRIVARHGRILATGSSRIRPGGLVWESLLVEPLDEHLTCRLFTEMVEFNVFSDTCRKIFVLTEGVPLAVVSLAHEAQQESNPTNFVNSVMAEPTLALGPSALDARLSTLIDVFVKRGISKECLIGLAHCPEGLTPSELRSALGMSQDELRFIRGYGLIRDVTAESNGGENVIRLVEPFRRFLINQVLSDSIRDALGAHFVRRALRLELGSVGSADGRRALADLRWQLGNFVAVLPLLARSASLRWSAVEAAATISRWARRSGIDVSDALLGPFEAALPANAIVEIGRGDVALASGDFATARRRFVTAQQLSPHVSITRANAVKRLADTEFCDSRLRSAELLYEDAAAEYQEVGSVLGSANAAICRAELRIRAHDLVPAAAAVERAFHAYSALKEPLGMANCRFFQAELQLLMNDLDGADSSFSVAAEEYTQLGVLVGRSNCHVRLAEIALAFGKHRRAEYEAEQARLTAEQAKIPLALGHALEISGRVVARDDTANGTTLLARAQREYEVAGDELGVSWTRLRLAQLASGSGGEVLGDPEIFRISGELDTIGEECRQTLLADQHLARLGATGAADIRGPCGIESRSFITYALLPLNRSEL